MVYRVKKGMTLTRPVKKRLKDELEVVYTLLPRSLISNKFRFRTYTHYAERIHFYSGWLGTIQ